MLGWAFGAGRWRADLLNGLVVLGCPHLGVAATNRSAEQSKRSAYMMAHQVGRGEDGLEEERLPAVFWGWGWAFRVGGLS